MHKTCMLAVIAAIAATVPTASSAQWLNVRAVGVPRLPDGKVNLTAPAPRGHDGRVDLSGTWMHSTPDKYLWDLAADLKPGELPFQPWAESLYRERRENNSKDDPLARCLPHGVPRINAAPAPIKVFQTPGTTVFLYEANTLYRQIFTDGRTLPVDPNPTWLGYSIGSWNGDTFVVTTSGFNGKAWLDISGHPATEDLRVVERFQRRDFGHLDLEVTIDDPKAYTRPWSVRQSLVSAPDTEIIEYICNENNLDPPHMVGK